MLKHSAQCYPLKVVLCALRPSFLPFCIQCEAYDFGLTYPLFLSLCQFTDVSTCKCQFTDVFRVVSISCILCIHHFHFSVCAWVCVCVYVSKAAILCLQRTINIQAWEKLWSDVFTAACVPLVLYIRTPNSQILNRTRSRLSNPGSACLAFRDEEGPDPSNKVCQESRNTLPVRSYWCANLSFLFAIVIYNLYHPTPQKWKLHTALFGFLPN